MQLHGRREYIAKFHSEISQRNPYNVIPLTGVILLLCKSFREKSQRKKPITKLATYFRHNQLILSHTTKRYPDDTWLHELLNLNGFYYKKNQLNKKVRVSTELVHIYRLQRINKEDIFIYIYFKYIFYMYYFYLLTVRPVVENLPTRRTTNQYCLAYYLYLYYYLFIYLLIY